MWSLGQNPSTHCGSESCRGESWQCQSPVVLPAGSQEGSVLQVKCCSLDPQQHGFPAMPFTELAQDQLELHFLRAQPIVACSAVAPGPSLACLLHVLLGSKRSYTLLNMDLAGWSCLLHWRKHREVLSWVCATSYLHSCPESM